jgi:hypothetical protein
MPLSPPLIFNFIKKLSDIAATILGIGTSFLKLEKQRGRSETRQTDYCWITLSWS